MGVARPPLQRRRGLDAPRAPSLGPELVNCGEQTGVESLEPVQTVGFDASNLIRFVQRAIVHGNPLAVDE